MFEQLIELSNHYSHNDLAHLSVEDIEGKWELSEPEWSILARNALLLSNDALFKVAYPKGGAWEEGYGHSHYHDDEFGIPSELSEKGWIPYYTKKCFQTNRQIQMCIDAGKDCIHMSDGEQNPDPFYNESIHFNIFSMLDEQYFSLAQMFYNVGAGWCWAVYERNCFTKKGDPILKKLHSFYRAFLSDNICYDCPEFIEKMAHSSPLPAGSIIGLFDTAGKEETIELGNILKLAPVLIQQFNDPSIQDFRKKLGPLLYSSMYDHSDTKSQKTVTNREQEHMILYLVDRYLLNGICGMERIAFKKSTLLWVTQMDNFGWRARQLVQPLVLQYLLDYGPPKMAQSFFEKMMDPHSKHYLLIARLDHPFMFSGNKNEDKIKLLIQHPRFSLPMSAHLLNWCLEPAKYCDKLPWNFSGEKLTLLLNERFSDIVQGHYASRPWSEIKDQVFVEIKELLTEEWKEQTVESQINELISHLNERIECWKHLAAMPTPLLKKVLDMHQKKYPGNHSSSFFYSSLNFMVLQKTIKKQSRKKQARKIQDDRF